MKKYIKLFLLILVLLPFSATAYELQPYYVQKIDEIESKITVKDRYGKFYVLTYGPECSGWWTYTGQRIYINARGPFLDGVEDEIFLNDLGIRACPVRKVSYVKGGPGYYVIHQSSICPDHGFISPVDANMCECTSGYKFDIDRHICVPFKTNDQICKERFGLYSVWDGTFDQKHALNCICKTGFIWNQSKTACVRDKVATNSVGAVAKTDIQTTNETPGAALGDSAESAENVQTETETILTNNTQNNTQRAPWYKTFLGMVIILVVVMLVVYNLVKAYKNRQ
ncbi:MAG: hypothetical protein KBC12_01985 [Candidatus Pacebacteria bacterium]|nr:hypothetical protein [Candidatus Paceibacterota bacterium]MBP9851191.1 hypothetical protein [Candidatus Paceibacterota bacterium]